MKAVFEYTIIYATKDYFPQPPGTPKVPPPNAPGTAVISPLVVSSGLLPLAELCPL
jgi:hypothetical protein